MLRTGKGSVVVGRERVEDGAEATPGLRGVDRPRFVRIGLDVVEFAGRVELVAPVAHDPAV
jgi:hypothetical protein